MKLLLQKVRKYPFSSLCIALIWVLSLAPWFPETPLDNVAYIDKWTHFVMYGGTCAVIWLEYLRQHTAYSARRLFVWAWLAPTLMGGVLELLQTYCTFGHRNGDPLDFLANTTGVTLGSLLGIVFMLTAKWWRTKRG